MAVKVSPQDLLAARVIVRGIGRALVILHKDGVIRMPGIGMAAEDNCLDRMADRIIESSLEVIAELDPFTSDE